MELGIFNLDLLSVGITVAATGILGFVVFFNNSKSLSNRIFLAFSLVTSAWGIVNYLNYQVESQTIALWLVRLVLFFAVWQAFCIFYLFYVFPQEIFKLPRWFRSLIIPFVVFTSILTLTPLVLRGVEEVTASGRVSKIANGPGMILFGFLSVGLVASGILILIGKTFKAPIKEKRSLRLILFGTLLTFALIIVFNFVFPAILGNANYIPFGAVFLFPFIAFTSYAIFRHGLLNIKILSTEILIFLLTIAMLIEVILSQNALTLTFRFSVFLLILGVGILLIKSVLKEVKQREQLQVLTKQLEEANEKLKVLDRARAEFISVASHQLRTPPATIKWYLAAVLNGSFGTLEDKLKEAITRAQTANNSQISLIDDLLNASRIERGKLEFNFESEDVEKVVLEVIEQLKPAIGTKNLKIEYKKPKQALPKIVFDREKIKQVVNNLVDNSIKYSNKGSIRVELKRDRNNIILSVADNGIGIEKSQLKEVFEKYKRGSGSARAAGLGLGLYLAKVILEQHKGTIKAESPGVNKGSVFTLTIPVRAKVQQTSTFDFVSAQKETVKTN